MQSMHKADLLKLMAIVHVLPYKKLTTITRTTPCPKNMIMKNVLNSIIRQWLCTMGNFEITQGNWCYLTPYLVHIFPSLPCILAQLLQRDVLATLPLHQRVRNWHLYLNYCLKTEKSEKFCLFRCGVQCHLATKLSHWNPAKCGRISIWDW